jgi:hypothetical protein
MFFNAHIFFTLEGRDGQVEPWRAMGAILPDSAFTGTIGWPDLHKETSARAFGRALGQSERSPQLVAGMLDHIKLDNRSHHDFGGSEGYAFSHQSPELVDLTAQACGVLDEQVARGLAHNFIESGVDINLLAAKPEFQETARRALQQVDLDWLATAMAKHWGKDAGETRANLSGLIELAARHDLAAINGWADCWIELTSLLLRHSGDKAVAEKALKLAVELTAGDYRAVLE